MAKIATSPSKLLVHFIGVGGIGISALAQWFLALNKASPEFIEGLASFFGKLRIGPLRGLKWAISGSDIIRSDFLRKLQKKGLKLKIGHKKGNLSPKAALVIYNQAIPASNPELKEARRLKIPTLTYPQVLGALIYHYYKTIAVAGAHGKSTTTALASLVLSKAGMDPTVIIGTKLKEFSDSNFRSGKSRWLVVEADEFKRSFHNYSPTYAIITNIDKEHLDVYKNLANVKKSFLKFIGNIKPGGILIANKDSDKLFALRKQIQKICKKRNIELVWYWCMTRHTPYQKIKRVLKIPGSHNVSNALGVYTLAKALGIKEKDILQALGEYRGAWRRMEYRGELRIMNKELRKSKKPIIHNSKFIIPVYDDYAHHPTEIKATLQAFREKFPASPAGKPRRKIICVFQPHQAHRTKNLFREFASAFDLADHLILLPIYQVAGRDKSHKGYTSADLAEKIKIRNARYNIQNTVTYLPSPKRLPQVIKTIIRNSQHSPTFADSHYVLVMMGAGNIVNYTDLLLRK